MLSAEFRKRMRQGLSSLLIICLSASCAGEAGANQESAAPIPQDMMGLIANFLIGGGNWTVTTFMSKDGKIMDPAFNFPKGLKKFDDPAKSVHDLSGDFATLGKYSPPNVAGGVYDCDRQTITVWPAIDDQPVAMALVEELSERDQLSISDADRIDLYKCTVIVK